MFVAKPILPYTPKPCPICGHTQISFNAASDINYPAPNVWFIARGVCLACRTGGPITRCSDAPAALESAKREWNEVY